MSQDTIDPLLRLSPPPSATPCDDSDLAVDQHNHDEGDITQSHLVDTENTPPTQSRDIHPSYPSYHDPYYHHHLTLEPPSEVVTINHHALPLSPSMTPPIVLLLSPSLPSSPSVEVSSTDSESDSESSESLANSPLSLVASDDDDETTGPEPVPVSEEKQESSPRLSRSRPGSLRHTRVSTRFSPYSVLRPINTESRLPRRPPTTTALSPAPSSCDNSNETTTTTGTTTTTTTTGTTTTSAASVQLTIDTALANSQCAAAQHQSRAAKTALAQRIQAVIDEDNFEHFLAILRQNKPDLNVFVNGQTALHYCLLRGRDVSWCKQLVLFGANPNLSSQDGWHPLHLAASNGHFDNLNYLISCNTNNGQQVK